MDRDILDLEDVLGRIQGDQELLIELIEIFLDDCPSKMKEAQQLITDQNYEQLSDIAHSLKGAASNIGAKKLWKTFLAMEEDSKSQKEWPLLHQQLLRAQEEFEELKKEFPALKEQLLKT